MANVQNNHELMVIVNKEAGSERIQELLPEQPGLSAVGSKQPEFSGSKVCLATNSEVAMFTLSPARKASISADNAAQSRSPVHQWQYSTINLHNVS